MKSAIRTIGMTLAVGGLVLVNGTTFGNPVSLPPNSANVLVPAGDTFAGDVGAGYTVLATYSATVSNGGGVDVTLYADAIKTSGGTVDILYQITNNGSAPIDSFNATNYSNIPGVAVAGLTDTAGPVGTNFVTPSSPANAPNTANRASAPAATIVFTFSGVTSQDILSGETSAIILVQTSSTSYDSNATAVASSLGSGAGSVAFNGVPQVKPASVPEPASLVMGSLALISAAGVYGFRRRRN
jgi:hypothetical protein